MKSDPVPADFTCWQCGDCCRGAGYVEVSDDDVRAMATRLNCSVEAFVERYTRLGTGRKGLVLTEKPNATRDCIFLNADSTCAVYEARPSQCRAFPYTWNYPGWLDNCRNRCKLPDRPLQIRDRTKPAQRPASPITGH